MPPRNPGSKPTDSKRIALLERRGLALELRRTGANYSTIAEAIKLQMGSERLPARYGRTHAYLDVQNELQVIGEEIAGDRELVRILELDRLDRLMLAIWEHAMGGDVQAIDRILKIMQRRALLLGLDAPIKHSSTTPGGEATVSDKYTYVIGGSEAEYLQGLGVLYAHGQAVQNGADPIQIMERDLFEHTDFDKD